MGHGGHRRRDQVAHVGIGLRQADLHRESHLGCFL